MTNTKKPAKKPAKKVPVYMSGVESALREGLRRASAKKK